MLSRKRKAGLIRDHSMNQSQTTVKKSDELPKKRKTGLKKQVELTNVINQRQSEVEESDKLPKKKAGLKKLVQLKNVINESQSKKEEDDKLPKKRKACVKKQVQLKNDVNESQSKVEEFDELPKIRKAFLKKQVELKNANKIQSKVEKSDKLAKKRKAGVKEQVELKNTVNEKQLNVEESDKLPKKRKTGLMKQVEFENVVSQRECEDEDESEEEESEEEEREKEGSEVSLDDIATEVQQLGKKLDNVAIEIKRLRNKSKKEKPEQEEVNDGPGVIFVSHIPHGFYEKEMKSYFSQFGEIRRFRLARSSKTGGCKGFAYVEFQSAEVAKIVAEAMDNYLFFEKLLKCVYVPNDRLHPKAFRGWRKGQPLCYEKNVKRQNKPCTTKRLNGSMQRRMERLRKLQQSLKKNGIDFAITSFLPDVHNCRDVDSDTIQMYETLVNVKEETN